MTDLLIGSVVIPAAILSAAGAVWTSVWTYISTKDLKRVESRLRREEEDYRLTQSPRVAAAIALWGAFCDLERWLRVRLSPAQITSTPSEASDEEKARDFAKLKRTQAEEVRRAWLKTTAARDRAEILLPAQTFAAFDAVFNAYDLAHRDHWMAEAMSAQGSPYLSPGEKYASATRHLEEAQRLRPEALVAFRELLGHDHRAR